MSILAILAAIAMCIYGARIQLMADIRTQAIKAIHAKVEAMIDDLTSYESLAALDEAIRTEWAPIESTSLHSMVMTLNKWTFDHFFPELAGASGGKLD